MLGIISAIFLAAVMCVLTQSVTYGVYKGLQYLVVLYVQHLCRKLSIADKQHSVIWLTLSNISILLCLIP